MKVFWTPGAYKRLVEIEAYLAQDSPRTAREITVRLISRSLELAQPPLLGRRLPGYTNADLRELLERPYRLIYRVTDHSIEIVTVMHYRQLLPSDLDDSRGI
jgi:plasmid stabilization system protein ParE